MRLIIALMLLSILACGPHWQDTPRPKYVVEVTL